ncbi:helix-turn-helix domain-containing protein [Nocardia sp. NPDC051990]|uniref:helix-turn-helix domain-containing protein n=1 Tax=Nocardia sp. NPDC051990 TaxID=3155285 RepID=UPI003449D34E
MVRPDPDWCPCLRHSTPGRCWRNTLEVFVDSGFNQLATARQLSVHRNTITYRPSRVPNSSASTRIAPPTQLPCPRLAWPAASNTPPSPPLSARL